MTRGFADPGEDVVIHFATVHPREEYGDSSIEITALLNYRPVDAVYEHYNADRSKVLERHEGIGAGFPIDGEAELIDITIPAEAFDGPGRYDIGLGWEADGPIDFPSTWRSFVVYYGGCKPPSHKCLVRGTKNKENETERKIGDKYYVDGFVYPGGKHQGQGPFEVQLDEGQTVTVNFSVPGYNRSNPHPYAVVPILRDKPLDQRLLIVTPPKDLDKGGIGYRGSFEVEIPDKPGRYDVEIGIWDAPFLESGVYSELGFGNLEQTTGSKFGTNDVTYVVKE
ncbi:MAG: hypothetical protein ABEN55_10230 [Bradymonadaceae bacterium]